MFDKVALERAAKHAMSQTERDISTLQEIASRNPVLVEAFFSALVDTPSRSDSVSSSTRSLDSKDKLDMIVTCFKDNDNRPMTYGQLVELLGLTRSAIRNVIETSFADQFREVQSEGRSRLWCLNNQEQVTDDASPSVDQEVEVGARTRTFG